MTKLGWLRVKGVALSATNAARARAFYAETLGLAPVVEDGVEVGFALGDALIMLKTDWYGKPTAEPNPRITIETSDARATEAALRARGVRISDPVADYNGHWVGAFLDSEGNKLWFCSMT